MAITEISIENSTKFKIGFAEVPCHINVEGDKVVVSMPSNTAGVEGPKTFAFSKTEVKRMFEELYTS